MKKSSYSHARIRWAAAITALVIGLGGTAAPAMADELVPPTAAAPSPTLQVSKTSGVDPLGETLTISGTDYATSAGGFYVQVGWIAPTWRPSEGALAASRSSVASYTKWVQAANSGGPYAQWTDNGDGTAGFSYALTVDKATLDTKAQAGYTLAVFTVGAGGVVQAANEQAVPFAFLEAPVLRVSKTTALNPAGETLTVSGSHYETSAGGFYVQVGWLASTWRPSEGALAASRSSVSDYTKWVQASNVGGPYVKWTDNGDGTVQFSYPLAITQAALDAKTQAGYTLAIFTVGAGGVVQAANELAVPIAFAPVGTPPTDPGTPTTPPTPVIPTTPASPASGLALSVNPSSVDRSAASTFAIAGSGYTGAGAANGVYVSIGSASSWQPGQVPASGGWLATVWVMPSSLVGGAFTTSITIPAGAFQAGASYGVATFAAHELSATDRSLDAWAPIAFGGATTTTAAVATTATRTPAAAPRAIPEVVGCPVDDASLTWGFKESFRSYVSGSIANGKWVVSNGATYSTPNFGWLNGAGGYDAETEEGVVDFAGAIEFTGHGGALDTTVANPRIQFVDADTAYLLLDIAGVTQGGAAVQQTGVKFARLDISAATLSGGVLQLADAPATLTAEGAAAFGTYPEGEKLDPVTVAFGVDGDCAAVPAAEIETVPTAEVVDLGWIWWLAGALLLAAIVAMVVLLRIRSRRA